MALSTGTRIGPYAVTGFIGAGAMGEVYRAHDARLGREVAVKVLPAHFGADPERLRRFDQEARTAGTLNHPHVLAIYDVGSHEGMPYVVSELLQGDTLRARLPEGGLPLRKTLDYGAQIARGLAAAHARGVVHRDLKPENLFVGHDGTVKILDFGLAKLLRETSGDSDSLSGTMTAAGSILGTVGYMAPEQARGQSAIAASDIFALGCVLYEMATGARAFHRKSPVETLAAILDADPPPFPPRLRTEAPGLVAIVLRCLEKEPGERFESARDLAFALGTLAGIEPVGGSAAGAPAVVGASEITFKRITFRRGSLLRARFTPDGHSVIYGGAWEGQPVETFWMHLGNPEGRSLGHPGTDVFSVGPQGEIAVCLKRRARSGFITTGTLARMPLGGGAPRQLLQNVDEADWNHDGTQLAVVREVEGLNRLEMPIGRVLFQTEGWISHARVARDGRSVAFIHHEFVGQDGGAVTVVDLEGRAHALSEGWGTIRGLAWSADGRDVWFTAHREGAGRNLHAVTLEGRHRVLHQVPGQLCIQDVLPDGRALLTHSMERQAIMVQAPGESHERDLSWLDWSLMRDMSADGQWILISESGEGGGPFGAMCVRPTDGSPAIQLGDGNPFQFSPDGAWVLSLQSFSGTERRLVILPTGVGEPRQVATGEVACRSAKWLPDARGVLIAGAEGERPMRLYRLNLEDGRLAPFGPEGPVAAQFEVSPDGRFVAARAGERPYMLYPLDGGEPLAIPSLRGEDEIQPWMAESGALLVARHGELPAKIDRIDLETGQRTPWRELIPPDTSGVSSMRGFRFTPDGRAYGYTYSVQLDDLYLVEGLR